MDKPKTSEFAHIGKSVTIKGELTGSEDLYVDGQVEGTIHLHENNLTIGPNGQVHADVNAKGVVVEGKLEGNIHAGQRAEVYSDFHSVPSDLRFPQGIELLKKQQAILAENQHRDNAPPEK